LRQQGLLSRKVGFRLHQLRLRGILGGLRNAQISLLFNIVDTGEGLSLF